jgi:hypothetical protein
MAEKDAPARKKISLVAKGDRAAGGEKDWIWE